MTLLAELSTRLSSLRKETTATEALGLLLQRPSAASALCSAIRAGAPDLPQDIRFATEVRDADGRPDVVGRIDEREVVFLEGKFWAGLTTAQDEGSYLSRLVKQHTAAAPGHRHVGALVFVVPPTRQVLIRNKLTTAFTLGAEQKVGEWIFATAPSGVVVAVVTWQQVLQTLQATGDPQLVADCEQLLALVDAVDASAFVPWSEEQLTDQETARRIHRLPALVEAIRSEAMSQKVATHTGGRRVTIKRGALNFGKALTLGGVPAVLGVDIYRWAEHGHGPLWLRFRSGASIARTAFAGSVQETSDGVTVPVPLPPDLVEEEVVRAVVTWLGAAADRLEKVRLEKAAPVITEDLPDDDDE